MEKIKAYDDYLGKEDVCAIKGIAIILMLMHHLWRPDRITGGELEHLFNFMGHSSLEVFGNSASLCVSIFAFVSGYGKCLKYRDRKINTLKDIKDIYLRYWQVFLIFIPIGFLCFGDQPVYCSDVTICNRYSDFNIKDMILNFLGLISTYNREWWFFLTYLLMTCMFPLVRYLNARFSATVNIFLTLVFQIVFMSIDKLGLFAGNAAYQNSLGWVSPYIACFMLGVIVAQHAMFSKLHEKIQRLSFIRVISVFLIVVIMLLRYFTVGFALDTVYAPIYIFALNCLLETIKHSRRSLLLLGKNSTYMWLIHSFFCYYFGVVSRTVVFFRWGVICLLVLILYSLAASVGVSYFWKIIDKGYRKALSLCSQR